MNEQTLRIHQFVPSSRANGPGLRAVLWVQGCTLGCPGCFNPETHAAQNGSVVTVDTLFQQIAALQGEIEGLTVSGGEPLQQRKPLQALLERVRRETGLSVLVFTGFSWEELPKFPRIEDFLSCVDVLLAGRYLNTQRVASGLLGSANKTVHFLTPRYTSADLEAVPEAEVIIGEDGQVTFSGINPLKW